MTFAKAPSTVSGSARESATIKTLDGEVLERAPYTAEIDASDIEKGTYAHYMLKEMDEQPAVIRNIIQ
ncbi:MAG: hypothetical protein ACK4YP_10400, partial [Myxococcota bacterium]